MKKIFRLMCAETASDLNPRKMLERRKKNGSSTSVGALIFAVFFVTLMLAMCGVYAFQAGSYFLSAGVPEMVIFLFVFADTMLVLITSAVAGAPRMIKAKNLDMLMAMPFSGLQIFSAKMGAFLIENYAYSAIVMVPAYVAYWYYAQPSAAFIPMALLLFVAIPLIPAAIGMGISCLLGIFSGKSRGKTVRVMLFSIAFVVLYFLFIGKSDDIFAYMFTNARLIIDTAGRFYPPVRWCIDGATGGWLSLLLFVAVSAAAFALMVFLVSRGFKAQVTRANTSAKSKSGKAVSATAATPFTALFRKECNCYFTSMIYFMNTAIGMLMMLIGVGYLAFTMPADLGAAFGAAGISSATITPLLIAVAMFLLSMSSTTASAVSIEGQRIYLLKSMPVRTSDLFAAKIALNLLVIIPPLTIAVAVITAIGFISPLNGLLAYVVMMLFACYISVAGLNVNLSYPKLEWTNEAAVVKQGMAVLITMGLGVFLAALCAAIYVLLFVFLSVSYTLSMLAVTVAVAAAFAVSLLILKKSGAEKFGLL